MSLRDKIIQILNEEKKGVWSTETKGFSRLDKGHLKFAEAILRERHSELVQYYKERGDNKGNYPNEYDDFVLLLKSKFPTYNYFHQIDVMAIQGYFDKYAIPLLFGIKLLTEYILNYKNEGEQQRIDIVPEDELWDYVKEQYFDCSREFFEHMWDEVLSGRRTYWNEGIKDRMWDELQPELEERMEDEEWQEETGMQFDDIRQEESYFHSYWYYPLQSLGWDEMQLCDYYREYINEDDIINYFFKNKGESDNWAKYGIGNEKNIYIINRNKLFW
jgi:hypothetical protein